MSRYTRLFNELRKRKEKALMPFVVVGDPDYNTSVSIIKTLIDSGADILELGLPFSDPIADGPTIQSADIRALKSRINTNKVFSFIKDVRKFTQVPIGLLVYYNLVYQRGINKFYKDAKNSGVDSILIADMPVEESKEIIKAARKEKIDSVFIVSPLTEKNRLKKILFKTKGFVYIVSRLGVTGEQKELQKRTLELIKRVRPCTKLPLCVGFGISKPEHVKEIINAGADGVIVGSAIVNLIKEENKKKKKQIKNFVAKMKNATRRQNDNHNEKRSN